MHNECLESLNNFLFDQCLPREFTERYISKYLRAGEATKIFTEKAQHPPGDVYVVYIKKAKDGRSMIHKNWTKVVRDLGMEQGTIWAFRFFKSPAKPTVLRLECIPL